MSRILYLVAYHLLWLHVQVVASHLLCQPPPIEPRPLVPVQVAGDDGSGEGDHGTEQALDYDTNMM